MIDKWWVDIMSPVISPIVKGVKMWMYRSTILKIKVWSYFVSDQTKTHQCEWLDFLSLQISPRGGLGHDRNSSVAFFLFYFLQLLIMSWFYNKNVCETFLSSETTHQPLELYLFRCWQRRLLPQKQGSLLPSSDINYRGRGRSHGPTTTLAVCATLTHTHTHTHTHARWIPVLGGRHHHGTWISLPLQVHIMRHFWSSHGLFCNW